MIVCYDLNGFRVVFVGRWERILVKDFYKIKSWFFALKSLIERALDI